jgi:1-acyl-sn-glycerol-3-phosphate acyltransferase
MLVIRSLTFNAAFYICLIIEMIVFTPFYFLAPRPTAWFVPRFWARFSLKLQEWIAGTKSRIEGTENLPAGPFILAPKHQSFWDTMAFFPYLSDPVYILKRELTWIPLFGWYLAKMKMIPIHRGNRMKALKQAMKIARERMADGRQLIIYPEGTRRAPGADPQYKWGIAEIYADLNVPVVPVAHVAGLYWPRRKFLRFPGTIHAKFLPPIEPGLDKEVFMERLIRETEAATDQLLIEAARSDNPPPMPPTAIERLKALGVEVPPQAG